MTAADDDLDQRQFALDRARHPFDQQRAARGRRIVDPLDRRALDARARFILAPNGRAPRALPAQSGFCCFVVFIDRNYLVIDEARGGGHRRLARGRGLARPGVGLILLAGFRTDACGRERLLAGLLLHCGG